MRGSKKYNLSVFNRWGQELFQTFDVNQGWDGFYNGELSKQDVYVWRIVVSSIKGEEKILDGKISLINEKPEVKTNCLKKHIKFLIVYFTFIGTLTFGQNPTCPSSLIYIVNGSSSNIRVYDPAFPISPSNPSLTTIPSLPNSGALALMPNINGGTLSPTFYTVLGGNYYYWTGATWTNTGHSTGFVNAVNIGGCGGMIFNLAGPPPLKIYTYNGTANGTSLCVIPTGCVADVVTDCNCDFYVFNPMMPIQAITKYSPLGVFQASYALVGIPNSYGGGGFAIIGNLVYYTAGTQLYTGSMGGASITFSSAPNPPPNPVGGSDWASCPFGLNIGSVSATITSSQLSCISQTATAIVNTTSSAVSFSWSGPGIVGPGNGTIITVNTTGTYTCVISTSGCTPGQVSLTTNVTQNACFSIANTPDCSGLGSATVTSLSGGGPFSYTWQPTSQTGSIATGLAAGTHTVFVFNFANNQTYTAVTVLTAISLPTIIVTPGNANICLGDKIKLTASGSPAGYNWSPQSGLNSVSDATVIAGPISTQNYTVVGTANNCTSSAIITVSVMPLPIPILDVNPSARVCSNSIVKLQGSGGTIYNWEGPHQYLYAGQTVTFVANNLDYGGVYTLTVTALNGCSALTSTIITIDNLPNGNLIGDKMKGCVPFCGDFSVKTSSTIVSEWWLDSPALAGSTIPRTVALLSVTGLGMGFRACFEQPGDHIITGKLKDTETNCINRLDFVIEAYEKPEADFTWLPEHPVEAMDEVTFTNTSKGTEQNKWNWFFMNNELYSENANTSYFFNQVGLYPVAFVVKNKWNCFDTIVKTIKVETDFNIYVPNVFTPNEDGLNDIFLPIVRGSKKYNLSVFNRWGQELFQTFDVNQGWDGFFNGELSKQDVYVWKIIVSSVKGEVKSLEGKVSLYR